MEMSVEPGEAIIKIGQLLELLIVLFFSPQELP
jgi:hypothetical protein